MDGVSAAGLGLRNYKKRSTLLADRGTLQTATVHPATIPPVLLGKPQAEFSGKDTFRIVQISPKF